MSEPIDLMDYIEQEARRVALTMPLETALADAFPASEWASLHSLSCDGPDNCSCVPIRVEVVE